MPFLWRPSSQIFAVKEPRTERSALHAMNDNNRTPRSSPCAGRADVVLRLLVGRANGSDVKLQAALPRERTSGAPLAAMHTQLTLSVCKRRDAVRLARHQPARPAGAASGGLSASAAS